MSLSLVWKSVLLEFQSFQTEVIDSHKNSGNEINNLYIQTLSLDKCLQEHSIGAHWQAYRISTEGLLTQKNTHRIEVVTRQARASVLYTTGGRGISNLEKKIERRWIRNSFSLTWDKSLAIVWY